MKQRKLFAILTLVAFMMTLLPMAAFAAPNRFESKVAIDKTSVAVANGTGDAVKASNRIKVEAYLFDGGALTSGYVYVASNREGVDFVEKKDGTDYHATNNVFAVPVDGSGKVEFYIWSKVAGKSEFGFSLANGTDESDNLFVYLTDRSATAPSATAIGLIDTETITFVADKVNTIEVSAIDNKDEDGLTYTDEDTVIDGNVNASGVDYYEIDFKVTSSSGAPVSDQTVEFSLDKTGAFLNKTSAKTNIAGIATVRVYADKTGTYTVEGKAGDESAKAKIKFVAGDLFDIAIEGTPDALTAKDTDYSFKIKLMDSAGSKITATAGMSELNYEVVSKPSDSDLSDSDLDSSIQTVDDGFAKITIDGSDLDVEGDYVVRVYLDNGKKVDVPFTVKKQGTITKLTLEYKEASLAIGAKSKAPTVKYVDAAGVKKNAVVGNITFTVSDNLAATIDDNGIVTATTNDKYAGREIVVTAVDRDKKLVATANILIGVQANSIKTTNANATVGGEGTVEIQVVDVNGNPVSLGNDYNTGNITLNAYVLSKPANALVGVDVSSKLETELKEKGKTTAKISSNVEGDVVVQFILTATDNATPANTLTFTAPATVTFGKAKAEVPGANKVTLFIGQQVAVVDGEASVLDVAPFIKDGRTFVPVRFIAEALGADVKYDAATQTVTATRGDDVVVLTIGSNVMTVNGEAQVTDVAPFIVDGRTVLPFRALAEAFGSEVAWDAATQSVVFEK